MEGEETLMVSSKSQALDPFVLEIIQDALVAIADEMFVTTQRTSQSTIVYEVLDFAVGLTDSKGALITQGNGVTLFLSTLSDAARTILEKFGEDSIAEGDIFITNDPYTGGGTHLSDVTLDDAGLPRSRATRLCREQGSLDRGGRQRPRQRGNRHDGDLSGGPAVDVPEDLRPGQSE